MLRWVAVVLPILFLVGLDILRHTVFADALHSVPGFIGTYAVLITAIVTFSLGIFALTDRLQQKVIHKNRQLSALNDIAKTAAAKLRLEELLETSLSLVLSNMRVDAGLICLIDLEREEHSVVSYQGFSQELVRRISRAKLRDDPVASEVVRTGQPVYWAKIGSDPIVLESAVTGHPTLFDRVFEDPSVVERAQQEGIPSGISVPLKFEGEVNGILAIGTREERHFSGADREFLEGIGGQLGMAIRNANLYEQSLLQNRELGALLAVGKVATSSIQLDELLSASLDTVLEVTSTDAAEIWLAEGDGDIVMRCHRGAHRDPFMERTRFSVGEGIPGLVAQSKEPILIHDLTSDGRFLRQKVAEAGFRAFCALPICYQNKLVGVMAVAAFSGDAFKGQREIHLLESVGEWLALAVENARLYRQVQDLAVLQERERIAREMHDGMAQLLGYINTQTIALNKFISSRELVQAQEELAKMQDIARDLYADVREGILSLRTAAHRQEGLISALMEYVERFVEMSGIKVEVEVSPDAQDPFLEPSTEIQLMRIVQEALTNVRKHSRATTAFLAFERNGDHLQVTIADNGQGFDLARLPATGWPRFGLHTMRERVEAVGGTLQIDATPGRGTKVLVRVPL
ncbi:MAG: GAF domain-containing sensor histidine kinase [Chloroflexi bacterium]|nr:GAF domain-containing sensor histidine kinase [Chloroflexota bacterium]